jgi:hypothetical protein
VVYPEICLTTEEKARKNLSVMLVKNCQLGTIQCVNMAAIAGRQDKLSILISLLQGTCGSMLGQCEYVPSFINKEFPTSADFESSLSEI